MWVLGTELESCVRATSVLPCLAISTAMENKCIWWWWWFAHLIDFILFPSDVDFFGGDLNMT